MLPLLSISLIAYAVSTCFNLLVRLGRIPDELLRTMRCSVLLTINYLEVLRSDVNLVWPSEDGTSNDIS